MEWSDWAPFVTALAGAPREPGVYLFRKPCPQVIGHAGMAGEPTGNGAHRPQGLYGRLSVYRTGKGAVSGFGEAALVRALADPDWVAGQLRRLQTEGPRRANAWAADAIAGINPEVSWARCQEGADAKFLEDRVLLPPWRPPDRAPPTGFEAVRGRLATSAAAARSVDR